MKSVGIVALLVMMMMVARSVLSKGILVFMYGHAINYTLRTYIDIKQLLYKVKRDMNNY